MINLINYIWGFSKATTTEILAALNGQGGNFGYNFTLKRFFGTHDDGEGPKYFATLDDLSSLTVNNASETDKGVVEVADNTEYDAGTDIGATGAPLIPKLSQIRAEMDTKVEIAEDLEGPIDAPRVKSSTTGGAIFVIKNIAATISRAVKATATELQFRTGDDTDFSDIRAKNTRVQNLIVDGDIIHNGGTTTVIGEQVVTKDAVMTLNDGEVGPGVVANGGFSGFEIMRGGLEKASMLWDEAKKRFVGGVKPAANLNELKPFALVHSELISAPAATEHTIVHGLDVQAFTFKAFDEATGLEYGVLAQRIDANTAKVAGLTPFTNVRVVFSA